MNAELQRKAIATACGWKPCKHMRIGEVDYHAYVLEPSGYAHGPHCLPDYLNDLNAMHEAEKALTRSQYWMYGDFTIREVVMRDNNALLDDQEVRSFACATAAQRAEAFLRTLNLWTE
jgi:hypothetical protein